jgi:hypothetical protein
MPKPKGGVAKAACIGLKNRAADWTPFKGNPNVYSFFDLHALFGNRDGLVYLARQLKAARKGEWELALGHDGGARMFVDGACVLTEPLLRNPAVRGRSCVKLNMSRGVHEIVVAMDLAAGKGWGIFFQDREVNASQEPPEFRDLSSGKGLCALINAGAPEVTLPLNAKGWHAIYLGLVGSNERGKSNAVKIKLTGDAAYQHRAAINGWSDEVLFKVADLAGQDLQIAQQSAGYPQAACLCYVKLVPLAGREVSAVRRDQAHGRHD